MSRSASGPVCVFDAYGTLFDVHSDGNPVGSIVGVLLLNTRSYPSANAQTFGSLSSPCRHRSMTRTETDTHRSPQRGLQRAKFAQNRVAVRLRGVSVVNRSARRRGRPNSQTHATSRSFRVAPLKGTARATRS